MFILGELENKFELFIFYVYLNTTKPFWVFNKFRQDDFGSEGIFAQEMFYCFKLLFSC